VDEINDFNKNEEIYLPIPLISNEDEYKYYKKKNK